MPTTSTNAKKPKKEKGDRHESTHLLPEVQKAPGRVHHRGAEGEGGVFHRTPAEDGEDWGHHHLPQRVIWGAGLPVLYTPHPQETAVEGFDL